MAIQKSLALAALIIIFSGCHQTNDHVAQLEAMPEQQHPLDEFEERNDDPLAAASFRFQRRLSDNGQIPERALMRAKGQRDSHSEFRARGGFVGELNFDWEWVGPGNIGGRIRPIVIHPFVTNVMYVGSASGGIWKTFDGGEYWFPLDDFLPSLSISDLVMHPEDPNTLYAATGEGFFDTVEGTSNTAAVRGAGIFLSKNAGATWNQIPSTDNSDFNFVNRLEFDPSNSSTLLAATNTGVWRSTDDGSTWNRQAEFHALDVKFNPNNAMMVVAGGHDTHDGPYFSSDGGLSWNVASGAGGHRQEIAWAPSEPGTVFAAVAEAGRIKVWQSVDGGETYSLKTTGNGIQTWSGYNTTIWVHPTNADLMIVGGVRLFRSSDGGTAFSQVFNGAHPDMHRIVPHPDFDGDENNTLYFATDGGIYITFEALGSSVTPLNNNLGITQFYGGAINPTTGHIIGGTQDNGTLFYSGDPQNWRPVFGGDGGYGAADPTDPNYFYGEVQRALIHRSTSGGVQNNSYIYNGPSPIGDAGSANTNFIPFFMLDPNDSNRMLVACERMWRSNNVKDATPLWESIKASIDTGDATPNDDDDTGNAHFAENSPFNLATIAVANGNSDIIWTGHNNGELYYSIDGTDLNPAWTRVDENDGGLPNRWVSTIVVDPRDHEHVYVAFMGWESDNLWETTDSGQTWNEISGTGILSIPDAPISALAMHQNLPGYLYVGTDVGMFTSTDNGAIWNANSAASSPGNVPIEQLKWKNDHSLLVVTHGRGMYLANEGTTKARRANVSTGVTTAGNSLSLAVSDNNYYEVKPRRNLNRTEVVVELELSSHSPVDTPVTFQFRLQSVLEGAAPPEGIIQSIQLKNFLTEEYEVVDSRFTTSDDAAFIVSPLGNPSEFVDPLTQQIQALVTWKRNPLVRRPFLWSVDVDEAVWLIAE